MAPSATSITTPLERIYEDGASRVIVVNPAWPLLKRLGVFLHRSEPPTVTDVLVSDAVQDDLNADFATATRFADLVAAGQVRLCELTGSPATRLAVTPTGVTAFVHPDDDIALRSTDTAVADKLFPHYASIAEAAAPTELRTPAKAELLETMADHLSPVIRTDFETALDRSESMGLLLDPVDLSLLLAADHELLVYDLGRWTEDIGIASKATVSRAKMGLEERGLIQTETVPIEIGRPRQRLLLGPAWQEDTRDLKEFVSLASEDR